MNDDSHEIIEHYDGFDEGRRITQGLGQLELLRTQEIVRRHLPSGPLRFVDIGGGHGVHAEWLARDGHTVHLLDPVPRHVEAARRLGEQVGGITASVGDARSLGMPDGSFDAALMFGPLYHLTDRKDRLRALGEAGRVVRPGGLVFVAAISRFASLFDGLARGFLFDSDFRQIVERDLREGQHRNPQRRPHWLTTAYFHHPDGLQVEARDAGLIPIEVLGLEGMAGWLQHLGLYWENDSNREAILFSARVVEAESALRGLSPHLLMVARSKPELEE